MERAGIPPIYREATLADLRPTTDPVTWMIRRAADYITGGVYLHRGDGENWLFLYGSPGTGKTHAACAIARAVIRRRVWPVRFWEMARLLDDITKGFRDDQAREEVEIASSCPLLVLDDVGVERVTGWTFERMNLLFTARSSAGLPTIITSNLPPSDLRDRLDDRIVSRIVGRARPMMEIAGPDMRRKDDHAADE